MHRIPFGHHVPSVWHLLILVSEISLDPFFYIIPGMFIIYNNIFCITVELQLFCITIRVVEVVCYSHVYI